MEIQPRRRLRLPPFVVPFNPDDEEVAPSLRPQVNPLRAAMSEPDYQPGGDVSPTADLPTIPLSARRDARPTRDSQLMDRGTRESGYQDQLQSYEPKNEGLGKTVLRTALGFLGGGPAGAVVPWLTRKRGDEVWRDRELARSEDRQDRGNALRRAGLQEELIRSQTAENQAQATRDRTPYDWFPQDTDGDGIPDSEVYSPVRPGARKQVFRKALTEDNPMVVEVKNADGSTARKLSYDHGRTWTEGEGLGDARPNKPNTAGFGNRQLQENIRAAEIERDGIWKTLKDNNIQPTMPGATEGQVIANPIYQEYIQRGRKLDDDIRDWKGRMKPESEPTLQSRSGQKRTMSQANLARYAKDHGMTVEQAKNSPELQGVVIR